MNINPAAAAIGFAVLLVLFLVPVKTFDRLNFFQKVGTAIVVELLAEGVIRLAPYL